MAAAAECQQHTVQNVCAQQIVIVVCLLDNTVKLRLSACMWGCSVSVQSGSQSVGQRRTWNDEVAMTQSEEFITFVFGSARTGISNIKRFLLINSSSRRASRCANQLMVGIL